MAKYFWHVLALYISIRIGKQTFCVKGSMADPNLMSVEKTRKAVYPISGGYAHYTIVNVQHPLIHYPNGWPFHLNRELTTPPKAIRELSFLRDRRTEKPLKLSERSNVEFAQLEKSSIRMPYINNAFFGSKQIPVEYAHDLARATKLNELTSEPKQKSRNNLTRPLQSQTIWQSSNLDSTNLQSNSLSNKASENTEDVIYPNHNQQLFYFKVQYYYNQLLEKAENIEQLIQENKEMQDIRLANQQHKIKKTKSKKYRRNTSLFVKPATTTAKPKGSDKEFAVLPEIYDLFLNSAGENSSF